MMNNCMAYNHADTIYHKEAKRLLMIGLKYTSKVSWDDLIWFIIILQMDWKQ